MLIYRVAYDPASGTIRLADDQADGWALPESPVPSALAIGHFDGVHLGHQEVIGRAKLRARELGLPLAVMTFYPHPRDVLGKPGYAKLLTPLPDKLEQFEKLGADIAYVVHFDSDFSRLSPEAFVERVLVPLGVETVVAGFDFKFGYRGEGTPDSLCQLARGRFAVEAVRHLQRNDRKVSSTLIREALQGGDVSLAAELLGRPYAVSGVVVEGDKRGRTIGFPTANMRLDEPYVVPKGGVYTVRVIAGGITYGGVMNIGLKPTFHERLPEPTLEAHLFDFDGDLYGQTIRAEFAGYLRAERKFGSAAELVEQIRKDAEAARSALRLSAPIR